MAARSAPAGIDTARHLFVIGKAWPNGERNLIGNVGANLGMLRRLPILPSEWSSTTRQRVVVRGKPIAGASCWSQLGFLGVSGAAAGSSLRSFFRVSPKSSRQSASSFFFNRTDFLSIRTTVASMSA